MIQSNSHPNLRELYFKALKMPIKAMCLEPCQDIDAASEVLDKTFQDMESLYELKYGCSPKALDTTTRLLMGALNLAYRVVRLEREAALQTRDLEETLTKLLDDVPDDPVPIGSASDITRPMPME